MTQVLAASDRGFAYVYQLQLQIREREEYSYTLVAGGAGRRIFGNVNSK